MILVSATFVGGSFVNERLSAIRWHLPNTQSLLFVYIFIDPVDLVDGSLVGS